MPKRYTSFRQRRHSSVATRKIHNRRSSYVSNSSNYYPEKAKLKSCDINRHFGYNKKITLAANFVKQNGDINATKVNIKNKTPIYNNSKLNKGLYDHGYHNNNNNGNDVNGLFGKNGKFNGLFGKRNTTIQNKLKNKNSSFSKINIKQIFCASLTISKSVKQQCKRIMKSKQIIVLGVVHKTAKQKDIARRLRNSAKGKSSSNQNLSPCTMAVKRKKQLYGLIWKNHMKRISSPKIMKDQ